MNAQGNGEVGRGRGGMHQPSFNQNVITVLYTVLATLRVSDDNSTVAQKFWNHPYELPQEELVVIF